MDTSNTVRLGRAIGVLLRDSGVDVRRVAAGAGLPSDLLLRQDIELSTDEYFDLLRSVEAVVGDTMSAVEMVPFISPEVLSPVMTAALCSSDLLDATRVIAAYGRLMSPILVARVEVPEGLRIEWRWVDPTVQSPALHVALDLVLVVELVRIATRRRVEPIRVTSPVALQSEATYARYFGTDVEVGPSWTSLTFASVDLQRPFLTANETIARSLERELAAQLEQLRKGTPTSTLVRWALFEALPEGESSIGDVARRMAASARTLQRQLTDDGTSFRDVLQDVRTRLATHYLTTTDLADDEIARRLGFEHQASFARAYQDWTGNTPRMVRTRAAVPDRHDQR